MLTELQRRMRVGARVRNEDGWIGLVTGFTDSADDVLYHVNWIDTNVTASLREDEFAWVTLVRHDDENEPYAVGRHVVAACTLSGPGMCRAVAAHAGYTGVITEVVRSTKGPIRYVIAWNGGGQSTSPREAFQLLPLDPEKEFVCPLCDCIRDIRKEGGADDPVCDSCWGHLHTVSEGLVWKDSATEIAGIRVVQADAGSVGFFVCVDDAVRPGLSLTIPCEKKDRDTVARRVAAATLIFRGKDLPLGLVPVTMPWKKETK